MKKIYICIFLLTMMLSLTACENDEPIEPTITVNQDGYVVVNGVKTTYQIQSTIEKCSHNYNENGVCEICNALISNEIQYSVSNGAKIETLPTSEQIKIDEYVADCKALYTVGYANNNITMNPSLNPYISFTDTFIYDFRNVNVENLDNISLLLWNKIKTLNEGESKPIMYIELSGYAQVYPNYKPLSLQNLNIYYGFFIFENETIVMYNYDTICRELYTYKFVQGMEIINCGNKYSEELFSEQIFNVTEK